MDKNILKEIAMPCLKELENDSYIIYGVGEMGDLYYEEITEKFGENSVSYFVDGRNQPEAYKNEKKILHYSELDTIQVNQYKYILATISASSTIMKKRLLEAGVQEENILPTISYFNVEELRNALNSTKEIYIYPEFEDISEWQSFYKKISEYVELKKLNFQFNVFIKNEAYDNREENITIHNKCFECENSNQNLILVRKTEAILYLNKLNYPKVFCIDEEFMFSLQKKMLAILDNEGKDDSKFYQDISKRNFLRMKEESQKYEAVTVFGAGPSVEEGISVNFDFLKKSFNIVCNDFFKLTNIMEKIKPGIYALSDSIYYSEPYHSYREKIVSYVNEHNCWLCMNIEFVRYMVRKYNLDENKVIGFKFLKDEVVIPTESRLNLYMGGSVVLTCSFPIGFSLKDCVYAIGCDGAKIEEGSDSTWGYQKGISVELDKVDMRDRVFGTRKFAVESFLPTIRSGYERILKYAVNQGKEYHTLTHSYFELLEKHYIKLK